MLFSASSPGCSAEGLGHLHRRERGGGWSWPCSGLKFLQRYRGLSACSAPGEAGSRDRIAPPAAYTDRLDYNISSLMASGINKIHQPGTCNGSKAARSSSAEECNQEMHMKMCKKIAQLTKVIYALNTKNDEHEASIQALGEAHEEEIQHILAETRETILQCKSKVEEEQLLRKRIQALEIAVEQHKRLKEEALAELTLCKKQVEEREPRTEVKQAQMVLSTDKELQTQLEEFKRKSECELKQLEKEKEVLTGKLQNSSLEVAQLKQILDQQANNFKESLKKHNLQSNKEKEKLLQDLQNTIKENQNVKLQLEASHQKVLKMLEKSKNQELKEAEERLKKEFNETFKIQHQSHRLEMQTLEEKAKKELHDELEQIQKQQTLLLGSLRMELSEQQTSCTNLKKQIAELQMELRSVRTLKKHQEGSSQSQIRSLHDELEKCQSEISKLKKENLLLKDTMKLLSAELESQKQEAAQLQDREKQHRRLLVEDLNIKHKKELDILKQDHRKEIENMLSDFSSTRAHLQAKIFSLETELKELEANSRKWESRSEDTHLISCLQDKLSERKEIIKQLAEGRKFQHSLLANTESYRNRSFSFNPNTGCSTSSMKQQKKTVEMPSRVVSVPNLASYAKSFLSCDLRSKRSAPQITKSTSLDRSPGCLRVGSPSAQSSDSSAAKRTHGNEPPQTKDDQTQDPQHQEWFTKYFSF
ncbi:protein FAM184B isoform 5-T5 [Spheniscus humboldti]